MAPRSPRFDDHYASAKPTLKARFAKSMRTGKLGLAFSAAFIVGGSYGTYQGMEEILSEPWHQTASPNHAKAVDSFDKRLAQLHADLKNYQDLSNQRETAFTQGATEAFEKLSRRTDQADDKLDQDAEKFLRDITMSLHIDEKEFADYYNALEDFPIDRDAGHLDYIGETINQVQASSRNECHTADDGLQNFNDVTSCMYYQNTDNFKIFFPAIIFGVFSFMFTGINGDGRTANAAFEKKFKEMENETKRAKPKKRNGKPLRN